MRIERSKYTSPPSPVEAFRRVSSKIGRKSTNTNFNDDDSNHRLLDRSSWDQSDDQRDDDMLPFNPTGKFVRKTAPMSPLGALKSPRSMKKALMSRVNAAVEHNSYFGHHESRDDDESNVGLLSRDGQYETRYENRWFDDGDDDEDDVAQMSQTNNVASSKPLLPDLVDFSGSSESTESSKDNATATIMTSAPGNEQERDGASASHRESLVYSVESVEGVAQESQEKVGTSSTNDLDEEETRVTTSVAQPFSLELDQSAEIQESIELEGSSSTVDFDDELSLAEHPVDDNLSLAEHPESIVQYETPVEVEEESEKKSIASSPTDIKSYVSYTRHDCPVVVSSSEHGDVILLSPKGFENIISAEATSSAPLEKEEESQDLSNKFEAIALADPSVNSRRDVAAETGQSKNQDEKADSDDEDDEFVISDDWSEDSSVGNSSDPFGECIVNENVVQNINEHRLEDNATFLGREKRVGEEVSATDNDTSSQVSDAKPVSEASVQLSDLETNQLTSMSSSSADLASFNQIWEGSTMPEESGSDSEDCDEGKLVDKKSNGNNDAWDVSRELLEGFKTELSTSGSSDDLDKSDSSKSEDRDSFVSLNNYWASEWNDLTVDDNKNIQDSLHEEDVEEDTGAHDKYSTALEEEDSDDFYGRGIVESSGDYSYDSYGLETISEEGEVEEDEPVMPPSCDESVKEDEAVVDKGERDQVDVQVIETVKECIAGEVPVDADEDVSLTAKPTNVARKEVVVVETVNEYSSDEEESNVEEERVQTITSNDVAGVQHEVVQSEVLHQLWSKIDEYQANFDNVEAVGETPRQTTSTKAITPVKKHAVVKHSIRDSMRSPSPLPRVKKAGSSDPTFDDLSRFLDGSDVNASLDSHSSETDSNHTEVLLEDGNAKSDMKRTSVKRHVFTRLFAPVSSLVNKRRSIEEQDLDLTKSGPNDSTDGNQEDACDESNVESEDDREARELAELLSAAMMAREQEKMEKSAAFAKQLAEIREAMAMEQELAEIEGDLHYGVATQGENCSSSDEDDSQIEILEEELVAETPTLDASNEVETKELQDLWSKIDEYQAKGKSLDTTQIAMMADMLNSQMEEYQAPETASAGKASSRPLRSLKHAVSMKKRAVVNAKAKKSKYDVSYIETKSIVKNKKVTETGEDLISGLESSGINNEPSEETKCLAESSPSLLDLETQKTCESADFDAPPQLCLIPSAMSINSFASIISADKSSESSLGGVSKAVSDMSKGSLVSKLYSDNTDLAETLAVTQCELEKALKQVERMKKEKEDLIATAVHEPVPAKSSFDDHFEPDALVGDEDFDNEWNEADLENNSGLCEI